MARAPRIMVIEPGGVRREVAITALPFRIGRQTGNELTLRDSRISRQQAQIIAPQGTYILEDAGSRHGTFVNGQKVIRHELQAKDTIDFGMSDSYQLVYVGETASIEMRCCLNSEENDFDTFVSAHFKAARRLSILRMA